jgi:hypothetical protein
LRSTSAGVEVTSAEVPGSSCEELVDAGPRLYGTMPAGLDVGSMAGDLSGGPG